MRSFLILVLLGYFCSCQGHGKVKVITESDMPEAKKVESIEGKQLNEFATSEIKPEVFFETGSKIRSAVIADNGRLFFGNESREFYAIDIAAKQKLWTYSADLAVQTWPVIADGKVIFNAGNTLYILDSANGNEIHKVTYPSEAKERVSFSKFAFNDSYTAVSNGVAWFPALDGALVGVNIGTGDIVWTYLPEYPGYVTSGINTLNGKLYYIDYSGTLCCVDIKSKRMIFKTQIYDNIFAPMHINDEKIYVAGRSCKVYCIDAKNGELIWSSFSNDATTWFSGGSVTIGDILYTCTSDEYALVSFDKNNGDFQRIYSTTVNAYTQPVLYGENIIVAATDVYSHNRSFIMEFDTKNHWKLWQCRLEDCVLSSPSIYEGVLYFGSDSGRIYSIKLK